MSVTPVLNLLSKFILQAKGTTVTSNDITYIRNEFSKNSEVRNSILKYLSDALPIKYNNLNSFSIFNDLLLNFLEICRYDLNNLLSLYKILSLTSLEIEEKLKILSINIVPGELVWNNITFWVDITQELIVKDIVSLDKIYKEILFGNDDLFNELFFDLNIEEIKSLLCISRILSIMNSMKHCNCKLETINSYKVIIEGKLKLNKYSINFNNNLTIIKDKILNLSLKTLLKYNKNFINLINYDKNVINLLYYLNINHLDIGKYHAKYSIGYAPLIQLFFIPFIGFIIEQNESPSAAENSIANFSPNSVYILKKVLKNPNLNFNIKASITKFSSNSSVGSEFNPTDISYSNTTNQSNSNSPYSSPICICGSKLNSWNLIGAPPSSEVSLYKKLESLSVLKYEDYCSFTYTSNFNSVLCESCYRSSSKVYTETHSSNPLPSAINPNNSSGAPNSGEKINTYFNTNFSMNFCPYTLPSPNNLKSIFRNLGNTKEFSESLSNLKTLTIPRYHEQDRERDDTNSMTSLSTLSKSQYSSNYNNKYYDSSYSEHDSNRHVINNNYYNNNYSSPSHLHPNVSSYPHNNYYNSNNDDNSIISSLSLTNLNNQDEDDNSSVMSRNNYTRDTSSNYTTHSPNTPYNNGGNYNNNYMDNGNYSIYRENSNNNYGGNYHDNGNNYQDNYYNNGPLSSSSSQYISSSSSVCSKFSTELLPLNSNEFYFFLYKLARGFFGNLLFSQTPYVEKSRLFFLRTTSPKLNEEFDRLLELNRSSNVIQDKFIAWLRKNNQDLIIGWTNKFPNNSTDNSISSLKQLDNCFNVQKSFKVIELNSMKVGSKKWKNCVKVCTESKNIVVRFDDSDIYNLIVRGLPQLAKLIRS